MKQIKFKHLATFGLCCSLLVNSFTGVTAVAETVTKESNQTEETAEPVTSTETTETEKKVATEQTEQTIETKNQQVHNEMDATLQDISEEDNQVATVQPIEAPTSSAEANSPKIESRGIPLKTIVYPKVQYDFVDETGAPFATPLGFSGNYLAQSGGANGPLSALPAPYDKLYGQANGTGSYILSINNNAGLPLTPQFIEKYGAGGTTPSTKYRVSFTLDKLTITTSLKFVESIEYDATADSYWYLYMYKGFNTTTGIFDDSIEEGRVVPISETNKDRTFQKNTLDSFEIIQPTSLSITSGGFPDWVAQGYDSIILRGFDGTNTIKSKMVYKVTRKQVTEKFVDANGVAITPPTGFTQNKKTPMTSNAFTFKQAGTLPDTYKASNGKTYNFKGWYKGKTKPNTLTTTKAPSYAVTYDGNDDLNVVYEEETVTTFYPSLDVNFVDEKGVGFTPALTFSGKYRVQRTSDRLYTDLYDLTSKSKGSGQYTLSLNNGTMPLSPELLLVYGNDKPITGANRLNFSLDKLAINQQLKYVNSIELDTVKSVMKMYGYNYTSDSTTIIDPNQVPAEYNMSAATLALLGFDTDGVYFSKESSGVFNTLMGYASTGGKPLITMNLFSGNPVNASKLVYTVTRKQVTENFVDTNGTKITPPTGFTQGNQIPMTSNTFKYTAARALPASYSVGGKTYIFQGWYKGKTKPSTLTTSTTPTYNTTFDGNDDMTAVYKEASISANLTMRGAVDVIDNGAAMEYWEVLLKNTGEAPLTSVKIKPTTDWAAGISTPTELFILGTGQNTKVRPITKEQWEAGFEIPLDSSLPVGGQLTINLLGTKVTGQPNQVLKAAVEVTGNFSKLTASDTVRIKDLDQETKEPTGEGFISVPTFNFGQVGVAGSTQQHSLKKAADYYGNGTRNPYLRIKKTQPNWSLTAQLSQPKSATDSLPTTTRLLLGTAAAASFTDYNQPTETKTPLGKTGIVNLTADNTATAVVANQQFTGSDVYQLDFTFANIKLEVPANQGMSGQQYQAAVTWNLVTGP
ncbi:WxL domain-containing protein [Enterococcus faecalis]|uniref:WxL domain-containing protein n=1 Tax=Enterococcus faecalis TaxID=1351 RepID=UPI000CF1E808|nr:WxL domain-containing protein [Enterococcus faecalis]EGO2592546.1 WxL domain-containing protein [Enterococcus faecalis]EGO2727277.1 WxL domain-containing protein [Enterococcus faecalis]EGO2798241.1 WxL domain-containing protein [Enterococcus faecalis]EGO5137220.1 WxL domain-containing protein [Enterococcus faecalis]EGO5834132.1 WxL domain-containing protein [Enterococcus faecalis]